MGETDRQIAALLSAPYRRRGAVLIMVVELCSSAKTYNTPRAKQLPASVRCLWSQLIIHL